MKSILWIKFKKKSKKALKIGITKSPLTSMVMRIVSEFHLWICGFDKKSKLNIIEGEDAMDAKVLRNDLIQVGI